MLRPLTVNPIQLGDFPQVCHEARRRAVHQVRAPRDVDVPRHIVSPVDGKPDLTPEQPPRKNLGREVLAEVPVESVVRVLVGDVHRLVSERSKDVVDVNHLQGDANQISAF